MDLILVNLIDGLVTGLLLFMLSAGLTLIFSMMGVLNFAHASFYMLGAYFAYQISLALGFWMGLLIAPIVVGVLGAGVERYGLRRVHQYGHVPELIFTFGLALLIEEMVQFIWGKNQMAYSVPEVLNFTAFAISGNSIPAYKIFHDLHLGRDLYWSAVYSDQDPRWYDHSGRAKLSSHSRGIGP